MPKILASAIVSAATGMPGRPRRVATSPSCATPSCASVVILRPQPDAVSERTRVLHRAQQHQRIVERHVGLRKGDAARLRRARPSRSTSSPSDRSSARPPGKRVRAWISRARCLSISTRPGSSSGGSVSGGQARLRHAARDRRGKLGFERGLVLESRLAQTCGKVDKTGTDDATGRVDDALRPRARSRIADARDDAIVDEQANRCDRAIARGRSVARCGSRSSRLQLDATMESTAMRTAMPNVTCGRITERAPSATGDSISTPRFIGPGCMTIASGFASASFSPVSP